MDILDSVFPRGEKTLEFLNEWHYEAGISTFLPGIGFLVVIEIGEIGYWLSYFYGASFIISLIPISAGVYLLEMEGVLGFNFYLLWIRLLIKVPIF